MKNHSLALQGNVRKGANKRDPPILEYRQFLKNNCSYVYLKYFVRVRVCRAMTQYILLELLWSGYGIGALFILACLLQPFLFESIYHLASKVRARSVLCTTFNSHFFSIKNWRRVCYDLQVGIRLRAAIIDTIYWTALRIASCASNGQIVNLQAVDLQYLQDMLQFFWMVWYALLNILIALVLLYIQVLLS